MLIKDSVPSFGPIFLGIGTSTYKLSKSFVQLLTPLTLNEHKPKIHFCLRKSF